MEVEVLAVSVLGSEGLHEPPEHPQRGVRLVRPLVALALALRAGSWAVFLAAVAT